MQAKNPATIPILKLFGIHIATLRDPCCEFARPILRLCATQISYVATQYDPCCDFMRLMVRQGSTHGSTRFDSIEPARLII